jgi:UDP-N-acetylmuramoyl-L-alanyl-D-glutamate--2,6-diaminopimelate ligase
VSNNSVVSVTTHRSISLTLQTHVLEGTPAGTNSIVEADRRVAMGRAIAQAKSGDTVLIAGKGHEDYQILGTEKVHFDDREEAEAALKQRCSVI